jgi:hypothetical protein
MRLRRQTKKRNRALDLLGTYLKFKAVATAAKTARKGVAGFAAYKAAKRAPTAVKPLPVVAGVGAAGVVAARKRRRSSSDTD